MPGWSGLPPLEGAPIIGFRHEVRYTSDGDRYEVDTPVVPHLPDLFLHSVFYLYPTKKDAETAAPRGGSGFLIRVGRTPPLLYAVTVKHVSHGYAEADPAPVMRLNTWDGTAGVHELTVADWVPHPDGKTDLTVACVELDRSKFCFYPLDEEWFIGEPPPRDQLSPGNVWPHDKLGPGTETFYIGRYVHHEGAKLNLPTVRFGNLAAMPSEPVSVRNMAPQLAYLNEARSLGGYSGSPVFASMNHFVHENGMVDDLMPGWVRLIGIHCAQLDDRIAVRGPRDSRTDYSTRQKTGMMVVIPVEKLEELLNWGPILKRRKDEEKKWERDVETGADPESADVIHDDETFTRDDFLDRLEKVSKPKDE